MMKLDTLKCRIPHDMTYHLAFEANPSPDDIQILGDGIMAYAKREKGFSPLEFFAFFIRDDANKIVGGCNGNTLYGCLYIDQLWLDELLRQQGYGTQLVLAAEKYGKENGCSFITANTMSWEALGFYQKCGFKIEFERHGFLHNSIFYFLRKELIDLDP